MACPLHERQRVVDGFAVRRPNLHRLNPVIVLQAGREIDLATSNPHHFRLSTPA
jgi:hypothetical protein